MPYARIDDQFYMTVKNATIDRDEQDLFFAGNVYCNQQLTDGFIPASVLPILALWAKLPTEANAQAIASRLVEHRYWELVDGGYMVHDFLDWNMSKVEILTLREARAKAGKAGGERSGAARKALAEANALALAQAQAQAKPKQNRSNNNNNNSSSTNVEEGDSDPTKERQKAIMAAYRLAVGYKLTTEPAENKAAKELAKTEYSIDQITACYRSMKGEDFWSGRHLGLASVAKQIGAFVAAGQRRSNGTNGTSRRIDPQAEAKAEQRRREIAEYDNAAAIAKL